MKNTLFHDMWKTKESKVFLNTAKVDKNKYETTYTDSLGVVVAVSVDAKTATNQHNLWHNAISNNDIAIIRGIPK